MQRRNHQGIANFYSSDASTFWFELETQNGSAHANLSDLGFKLITKKSLEVEYSNVTAPIEIKSLSFGRSLPLPCSSFTTACIAKYAKELKESKWQDQTLDAVLNDWMRSMPGHNKYIASLNPENYLFATSSSASLEAVLAVQKSWNIDSYLAVFDDTAEVAFIFDHEFGAVYVSYGATTKPKSFEAFAHRFNNEFKSSFAYDAKVRTGADPARAQEYLQVVVDTVF